MDKIKPYPTVLNFDYLVAYKCQICAYINRSKLVANADSYWQPTEAYRQQDAEGSITVFSFVMIPFSDLKQLFEFTSSRTAVISQDS